MTISHQQEVQAQAVAVKNTVTELAKLLETCLSAAREGLESSIQGFSSESHHSTPSH